MNWLNKSIFIGLNEPLKDDALSPLVEAIWDEVVRIHVLSPFKALVLFASSEALVLVLSTLGLNMDIPSDLQ